MGKRTRVTTIQGMKGFEKVVCLTAYDWISGRIADEAGVDLILVGDSVGSVVLGYESTVPVTLEEMEHHTRAVRRGVRDALLVADLPFGSYGASVGQAVESAARLMKAGAEAVKLEGDYPEEVRAMVRAGIPVMGHVGFTPQSVHSFGGHKVQGRGDAELGRRSAEDVMGMARRLSEAGVFALVLELVPAALAAVVTANAGVVTIGIGAGPDCDGEIQVFYDVLGFSDRQLKHARRFVEGRSLMLEGAQAYVASVRDGSFPTEENSF